MTTAPAPVRALIRCDGAAPGTLEYERWDIDLPLASQGDDPGLNLRIDGLSDKLFGQIAPRVADLIRIAAYVYAADQIVSRGGSDVHRERWRRCLTLCIPVTDLAFWADEVTSQVLVEALNYGTDDAWSFKFSRRLASDVPLRLAFDDRPLLGDPDSVVLFSGGTDSLCALLEAVGQGARPIVVSHRPAPPVDAVQKALLGAVRARMPEWSFPPLSFWIHRKGSDAADSSQRTRGFLFAALGLATAAQIGVRRVLLPDNGYVSINPSINDQLVGALTSRGTHPAFLRLMNRLATIVFPAGPQLENPLADRTRAQALSILTRSGTEELLGLTRSCSKHRGRPRDIPHCGGCSQCIDRRFAVLAAGLEEHDPSSRYGLDIFTGSLPEGEARTVGVSYARFAQATERITADALYERHAELVACLDPDGPDFSGQAEGLAGVLFQHAREVIAVLSGMVERNSEAIARGELPDSSLLALVGTTGRTGIAGTPRVAESAPPPVPLPVNRFERGRTNWHVEFHGEKAAIKHSVGMERLARLLKATGQEILARELVSWSAPVEAATLRDIADFEDETDAPIRIEQPQRRTRRPVVAGDSDLEHRARELAHQLQEEDLTERDRERIIAELDTIASRVAAADGKGGPRQASGDAFERARTTVWQSLQSTLTNIDAELPELRAHLDRSLRLGLWCSYDPHPPEQWRVELVPPSAKRT